MITEDNLYTNDQLEAMGFNTPGNKIDVNVRIEHFINELLANELSSIDLLIKEKSKKLGVEIG